MLTRALMGFPGFGPAGAFAELARAKRQMAALADLVYRGFPTGRNVSAGVFPSINLTENKENYFLRAELPGMKAAELDIQVVGRSLAISGERKIQSEGENVKYHRSEREAGKFSRVIGLPGEITADKVEAKMVDGLLTVTLPKSEEAKPKQITVN